MKRGTTQQFSNNYGKISRKSEGDNNERPGRWYYVWWNIFNISGAFERGQKRGSEEALDLYTLDAQQ